jgi:hypothetical protein
MHPGTVIRSIPRTKFVQRLTELPLRPIIMISYWRYRFNDMLTGTRVSLDYSIRSWPAAPAICPGLQADNPVMRGTWLGVIRTSG